MLLGAILIAAAPVAAAAEDEPWRAELRTQLEADQQCDLNYLTDVRQFELLGKKTIAARAHCMDKRAFDVERSGSETSFRIEICATVSC